MGTPGGCTPMRISARRALRGTRKVDCHEFETSLGSLRLSQKRKRKQKKPHLPLLLSTGGGRDKLGERVASNPPPLSSSLPSPTPPQERRRAERAEQQRFRTEKERERQAKLAVGVCPFLGDEYFPFLPLMSPVVLRKSL